MLDFTKIKGDTVEAQRSLFEKLVCHLAQLDEDSGEFRRIEGSGGDGGVEAVRIFPTGKVIGYQAKYYPARDRIDWSKLDKSVETALVQYPQLQRYVFALPCDFTGNRAVRGGSTEGIWGKWDSQAKHWKELATTRGMKVDFEPWTAFEIEAALMRPDAQHLIPFFFDQKTFTQEWLRQHWDRTIHDLQARYSPNEHVDTESLKAFDVIYRRENVRQELRAIFDVARTSCPRDAAALLEGPGLAEEDVITTEHSLKDFLTLGDAINWSTSTPWPVFRWLTSWHSLTRQLNFMHHVANKQAGRDGPDRRLSELTKLYELTRPEVFGGRWAYLLPIDGSRAAIFIGPAGSGKSHALARGSETARKSGAPVVHILGQHIVDDDPRASILKRLEIADWSFHDALSALNLAAELAGTRAMLVIDALNEGRGTDIWRSHLASFIREVNEYENIFLVASCREEYLQYVIPSELLADPYPYPNEDERKPKDFAPLGKLIRVDVAGFRTMEEREAALQKFMDDKGIARPTAPILDNEFFKPLFMSSVCRSMAKAGIKVFPRGLHGAREIFGFVLETKAKTLGTRHDGTDRVYKALLAGLSALAGVMVKHRKDNVPLREAIKLIDSAFETLPINGQSWLDALERSDILRRDVETSDIQAWSAPDEVIRFSFQRLQDNLMAERFIYELRELDIEAAFEPEAPLAFLVRRFIRKDGVPMLKLNPHWVGVLGALWAAVAETHGKELWDLRSFFGSPDIEIHRAEFRPVFLASVRGRNGTALTARTKELLDFLWEKKQEDKLAIFLTISCVPRHAWNADFLAERLLSLLFADRESAWSRWFEDDRSEVVKRAIELTEWALSVDVAIADAEVVRLAGITLTCLLTVANPKICERATKGLAHLLAGAPALLPELENRFRAIDDPNIRERFFPGELGPPVA